MDGRTTAVQARRALTAEAAFAALAGEDQRPLLVVRECLRCNGTDDALLTRGADNERTLLMTRWFNCVKLPPDVLEEDHPFHVLFADKKPGHLFLARWDGSQRTDLSGEQSRTELWDHMESFLTSEYRKGSSASLKKILRLLDRFDRIDADLARVKEGIDDKIEKGKMDSRGMKKLQKRLDDLRDEKARTRAEAVRLSELPLKERKVGKKPASAVPGAG